MAIIDGVIKRWFPASCRYLVVLRIRIKQGGFPVTILTAKLGTREESPCGLINDLNIIWCRGIMVRVCCVETVFQASPVGRVKTSPELLIAVVGGELTFAHKRTSYSEKLAMILIEVVCSVHAGSGRFTNELAKMPLSVSLHLGVVRI